MDLSYINFSKLGFLSLQSISEDANFSVIKIHDLFIISSPSLNINYFIVDESLNLIASSVSFFEPFNIKIDDYAQTLITKAYDGYDICIFCYNNIWYYTNGLNIIEIDIKNKNDSFINVIKIYYDKLSTDKDNIYNCNIITSEKINLITHHNLNKNKLGSIPEYKEMIIYSCHNKKTLINNNELDIEGLFRPEKLNYQTFNELMNDFNRLCNKDHHFKNLNFKGFHIQYNNKTYYLYSELYMKLMTMMPKYDNKYLQYIDLYKSNLLRDYIQFTSDFSSDILHRIDASMKTISNEFLDLYYTTRKDKTTYNLLTPIYKKTLDNIHSIYISRNNQDEDKIKKPIKINDIYYYLKSLSVETLREIFLNRNKNNINLQYCIFTLAVETLIK
jgi:hypothetical protein